MCIRDRYQRRVRGTSRLRMGDETCCESTCYRNMRTGEVVPTGFSNWSKDQQASHVAAVRAKRRDQSLLGLDCSRRKTDKEKLDGVEDAEDGIGQVWTDGDERIYLCMINHPGVGYRNSPKFDDKAPGSSGPQNPQVISADRIAQGPQAVFVRDSTQMLWLPLTDPSGTKQCFQLIGRKEDPDMLVYADSLNQGKPKIESPWFRGEPQSQETSPKWFKGQSPATDNQSKPQAPESNPKWFKSQNPAATTADQSNPHTCLLYTSPSPRDRTRSRMPSSA
eukprot:TRINITY_DN10292_c0_g2_i2.p1 TRINITY_DN10292_c0_g2~~TRINITY_DN10292_c0_g2_i2.p1  ORF type:complete len:278 (-),score=58.62 TRINITY_DN10292_c0_g2_i2:18-851(-)